jgi:drug/metabolite transporter (DMT)-like permease
MTGVHRRRGVVLVGLSAIAWSSAGIFTKGIIEEVWVILFWRGLFSAGFIALYVARQHRGRTLATFASLGLPGWTAASVGSLATVCYLSAFKFTSVASVIVIYATTPFVAAGLIWLVARERTDRTTLLASGGALAGVTIMVGGALGTPNFAGDILALAMAVFMVAMMVLIRRYPATPMVAAMCVSSLQVMVIGALVADPFHVSASDMWWLVAFGLVQAAGIVLLTEGTRLIPTPQAALIGSLEIPLAPLWAWLILTEVPARETFLGGSIVFAALALYMCHERRPNLGGA